MDTAEQDMVLTTTRTTPAAVGCGDRTRCHLLQVPAVRLLVAQPKSLTRLRRPRRQVPTANRNASGIPPNSAVKVETGSRSLPQRRDESSRNPNCREKMLYIDVP